MGFGSRAMVRNSLQNGEGRGTSYPAGKYYCHTIIGKYLLIISDVIDIAEMGDGGNKRAGVSNGAGASNFVIKYMTYKTLAFYKRNPPNKLMGIKKPDLNLGLKNTL